jgi:hypothetical protein
VRKPIVLNLEQQLKSLQQAKSDYERALENAERLHKAERVSLLSEMLSDIAIEISLAQGYLMRSLQRSLGSCY